MELEHSFEVPVGIDAAWPHLLDMEKVAACFPGANLTSSDGDQYTGTVKVKLGPIQLTYAGSARIIAADEATHTATIEASGTAARSGSTAAMTVVAAASALAPDRTTVTMRTDLTITGKPAQFGRGVMVEVGNKILGMFADCLAGKLAEASAGIPIYDASAAVPADSGSGEPEAGSQAGGDAGVGAEAGAGAGAGARAGADAGAGPAAGAAGTAPSARQYTRTPDLSEPIDLLQSARGSIIKRLAPIAAGLVVLCLWRALARRCRARR